MILISFLFFLKIYGQNKQDVLDEIKHTYENYETAIKKARNALSNINDSYNAISLSDKKSYASSAESEARTATRFAGYAEAEADDVKEATESFCFNASDEAEAAEDYFYSAKQKIYKGISELSSALNSDNIDEINIYLQNAKDFLNQGIKSLNNGVDELNNTISELKNNCN